MHKISKKNTSKQKKLGILSGVAELNISDDFKISDSEFINS